MRLTATPPSATTRTTTRRPYPSVSPRQGGIPLQLLQRIAPDEVASLLPPRGAERGEEPAPVIEAWVKHNVGTVADRALTLRRTAGYRRSFLVATNQHRHDLQESRATTTRQPSTPAGRAAAPCCSTRGAFNSAYADWFCNWSAQGRSFKVYIPAAQLRVLRMHIGQQPDVRRLHYPSLGEAHDVRRRLLSAACAHFRGQPSVRELFFDPEVAWDVVVSTLQQRHFALHHRAPLESGRRCPTTSAASR